MKRKFSYIVYDVLYLYKIIFTIHFQWNYNGIKENQIDIYYRHDPKIRSQEVQICINHHLYIFFHVVDQRYEWNKYRR